MPTFFLSPYRIPLGRSAEKFSHEDPRLPGQPLVLYLSELGADGELKAQTTYRRKVEMYLNPDESQRMEFPVTADARRIKISEDLFATVAVIEQMQERPPDLPSGEEWRPYDFEGLCLFSAVLPTAFRALSAFCDRMNAKKNEGMTQTETTESNLTKPAGEEPLASSAADSALTPNSTTLGGTLEAPPLEPSAP